jgi:hypothetical protein
VQAVEEECKKAKEDAAGFDPYTQGRMVSSDLANKKTMKELDAKVMKLLDDKNLLEK